jgi:hypothetical protein
MEIMAESIVERVKSKDTQERVLKLLQDPKEGKKRQDSDERLCAAFWAEQAKELKIDIHKGNILEFLKAYAESKFTPADDITRARRIVQNKNEEVRGTKWNQRHGMAEDVRENINKQD